MPGDWQHYLPASYLAGFSDRVVQPARDSLLWVGRRSVPRPWRTKAARIAAAHKLYSLPDDAPTVRGLGANFLDDLWTALEPKVPAALDALIGPPRDALDGVDAQMWAGSLVPFVAQVFVRGIDFARRIALRALVGKLPPAEQVDLVFTRIDDFHWLLGAIARTEWTVMHLPPGELLLTSDMGRVPLIDAAGSGAPGWGIPLRRDAALMILSGSPNAVRVWPVEGDRHMAGPIRHVTMTERGMTNFNETLAQHAFKEIYGGDEKLVRSVHAMMTDEEPHPIASEPLWLTSSPEELRAMELSYRRLAKALGVPPSAYPGMTDALDPLGVLPVFEMRRSFREAFAAAAEARKRKP